jgi:hypothetical protein
MGSRWREFIEDLLPWFDAALDRQRDRRTESIRQRSIASRIRAERVIDDYRRASLLAARAGELVIKEARRTDDR